MSLGDVGIRLPVLPRLPLALVLWREDTEFPAEGKVLFDSSVSGYLPVEDIVVLAETVVWKLGQEKKTFHHREHRAHREKNYRILK